MRAKKIIASVLDLTLISGGVCGTNMFTTGTVSANDAVSDDVQVSEDISTGTFSTEGTFNEDTVNEDTSTEATVNEGTIKDGKVTFGLTDAVVKPGETTYLDIKISENTGFCCMFLKLDFDESVFSLESMSVLPEFTGKEYNFAYRVPTKNCIFMNDCHDNTKEIGSSLIRVALKVSEDASEGDYTIGLEKGDKLALIALTPDRQFLYPEINCTSGTVTVNKDQNPKTNVSPMPLGRVYAQMDSEMILNKTGDLTNDGSINVLDVQKLSQYLLGTRDTAKNGDTNEDGSINAVDYLILKSYIIGK